MRRALLLLFAAISPSITAQAHHSFTETYLADKTVVLDGTLSQFGYHNPHSFVEVTVKDVGGSAVTWNVEWSGASVLARAGINRSTLKPGDHVIVVGNPSRYADEHRARLISITRPSDGWKWAFVQD